MACIYLHIVRTDVQTDIQTKQAIKRATIEEKQPKERKKKWSHHTNLLLSSIHRIKQPSVTRTLPRQSNFSQNTSYKAKQACIAIAE
jgi:hypothetical protein